MFFVIIIIMVNGIVFFLFMKSKWFWSFSNCFLLSLVVCDFMNGFVCMFLFLVVVFSVMLNLYIGSFNYLLNNCVVMLVVYYIFVIMLESYYSIKKFFVYC